MLLYIAVAGLTAEEVDEENRKLLRGSPDDVCAGCGDDEDCGGPMGYYRVSFFDTEKFKLHHRCAAGTDLFRVGEPS